MSNSIFDQMRDAARRAAQDLDERFDLKNKVGQGIDTAGDMARKAEAKINEAAGAARERFDKIDEQYKVTDNLRDKAAKAEDAAREVFGAAQSYYHRAEQAYNLSASGARVVEAAVGGVEKARAWIKENPGKAAVVTFSMIAGVRMGSALPSLGVTILGAGAANNWLFHSALPIVGLRKLTEKYNDYLKQSYDLLQLLGKSPAPVIASREFATMDTFQVFESDVLAIAILKYECVSARNPSAGSLPKQVVGELPCLRPGARFADLGVLISVDEPGRADRMSPGVRPMALLELRLLHSAGCVPGTAQSFICGNMAGPESERCASMIISTQATSIG